MDQLVVRCQDAGGDAHDLGARGMTPHLVMIRVVLVREVPPEGKEARVDGERKTRLVDRAARALSKPPRFLGVEAGRRHDRDCTVEVGVANEEVDVVRVPKLRSRICRLGQCHALQGDRLETRARERCEGVARDPAVLARAQILVDDRGTQVGEEPGVDLLRARTEVRMDERREGLPATGVAKGRGRVRELLLPLDQRIAPTIAGKERAPQKERLPRVRKDERYDAGERRLSGRSVTPHVVDPDRA